VQRYDYFPNQQNFSALFFGFYAIFITLLTYIKVKENNTLLNITREEMEADGHAFVKNLSQKDIR